MGHSESTPMLLAVTAAALPDRTRKQLLFSRTHVRRIDVAFRVFATLLALGRLRSYLNTARHVGARGLFCHILNFFILKAIALPGIRGIVEREVGKEIAGIEKTMHGDGDPTAIVQLPAKGLPAEEILEKAREMVSKEAEKHKFGAGKSWAGIYHPFTGELADLQNNMWSLHNSTNMLYEGTFPSVRKYEAEIISWVLHLLHGDPAAQGGLLTSGGTESVLLATLAYREQGRQRGIARPRVVAANTSHPAIAKACHYFGMELTKVSVDASTGFALTARAVRPYLSSDVVMIYASAPTFPHGVVDHIEDLGRLASSRGIGLHSDNCLGGILLSYMDLERVSASHQLWDFRAQGVTSISTDVHKYGKASKGVSVVSFRDKALRGLTYVPVSDGCEGLYITNTLQGARGGAVVAQAWATMLHTGHEGYAAMAREHAEVYQKYQEAVSRVPGLRVLCPVHASIVPIASDTYNIYSVASLMSDLGWNLFTGQMPPVMSVCLGESHGSLLSSFEADLRSAVKTLDVEPDFKPKGQAAVYGAMSTTPSALLDRIMRNYADLKVTVKTASSAL